MSSNVIIGSKTSYSGNPPGVDHRAGQRETQNELTLDGVSIMNNLGNVTPARPGSDMVSEVQMQSGNYTAQYGSYLGVHVNMVSKAGTNNYHGVVYDYIKNTDFDAHNFFDTATTKKAPLNYNQWGFTLGGPVWIPKLYNGRNKTFFFGSYEKLNQKALSPGTSTVMTAAMEAGDFSALGTVLTDPATKLPYVVPLTGPNAGKINQIPASELSTGAAQIAQKYEAYVPLPNVSGITNNLFIIFPNVLFVAQTLERVDENIGEKVKLFARFHWQNLTYENGNAVPVGAGFGPGNSRNYAFGYTHIITPRLVNDFHFGINQFTIDSLNYWYIHGLTNAGTSPRHPRIQLRHDRQYAPVFQMFSSASAAGMNTGNNGTNWFQDDRYHGCV